MTQHLMLDLETLGTRPGFMLLSAALVRFSDEAHTSLVLDRKDQAALGLTEDPDTLAWWEGQSNEAWCAAVNNPVPLRPALDHLSAWIAWATQGGDFMIWCHGATFDCPLIEEVYRRAGVPCPWQFWQVRCTRTLYDLAGIDVATYRTGTAHVALHDAIAQVRAANAALGVLARVRGVAANVA